MNSTESPSSAAAWDREALQHDPHVQTDKADRVQRMFAAIAGRYDLNNRLHSFGRDQAWRRKAVAAASLQATDRVLDVACGTGDLSIAFLRAGAASITGIDFTEPMLKIAKEKASRDVACRNAIQAGTLTFQHGDAMSLPFDDATFDVVSIAFGIRNVQEPARALAEFHRVLRPGGRLVVLEFSRPRNRLVRFGNDMYTHHIMPWTASLIARDRSGAYRYLPRSIDTFLDGAAMCDAIKRVGFSNVAQQRLTLGVCSVYRGEA